MEGKAFEGKPAWGEKQVGKKITAIRQLTKEQAIEIYNSGTWKEWTDEDIVKFQLFQDKLAIPIERFHEAIEKVLNRPVWTHEFAFQEMLQEEYLGIRSKPTFKEILDLIPKDKLVVIF